MIITEAISNLINNNNDIDDRIDAVLEDY